MMAPTDRRCVHAFTLIELLVVIAIIALLIGILLSALGHPDPRVNLAITLEKAGRVDEAIAAYTTALEVDPDYLAGMEGLSALQLSAGKTDPRWVHMLDEIGPVAFP